MIDLGKTMGGECCPVNDHKEGEKYYPTIYIDDVGDIDLPLEGKAVIEYKVVRDTKDRVKKTRELVIEVRGIAPKGSAPRAEDVLDKLLGEMEDDE